MKRLGLLCIGDELLDGRVRDKNAHHVMMRGEDRLFKVVEMRVVRDDEAHIIAALDAMSTADIIVVSGGLGPTADDRTRDAAANWSEDTLLHDETSLQRLQARAAARGYTLSENNRRQCSFPSRATILATEVGTAPGFRVDHKGTQAFFFPGVPREFQWFVQRYLLPVLGTDSDQQAATTRLQFYGPGESKLETDLAGIEELATRLQGRVGYRASFPRIEVSLKAPEEEALAEMVTFVKERIGTYLITEGHETFFARVGRRLKEAQATVAVAESCTGGMLGAALTETPGSSAWFERGFLTYANQAKIDAVGVHPELLEKEGAVSAAVVCQMARGAAREAGAPFGLAISGVAGPAGGTPEKPVGTVDFALATPEGTYHRRTYSPGRDRDDIRLASVYTALSLLLWRLEDRLEAHTLRGPFDDRQVDLGVPQPD
ncbi:damage-inducible protein CinA [Lujinxingia litoralis]|uniref:CinA-like protein n=1 Tax=Lujinxingia litoralis TaxID=2211119 RepID=A0A328CBH9_9DELT|nr:CinA family nicotinamide mononucleotide deamidase-related protein [Lujinxingia litoralis]RAL24920.1 damage-inducible protein CinA [Lujinxingia litoralis]